MVAETLRADARSNRDQIVVAALMLFRDKGVEVSMKEIADQAGVGVGTLYRRFPGRDALISAAAHAYLADLADRVAAAACEERDAWSALARFLRECALTGVGAFASSVEPALHTRVQADPKLTQVRARVTDAIGHLVTRAHVDGTLRPDVDTADIARLMTVQIYSRPTEDHSGAVGRVVDLLLDGMRVATYP